MSTTALLPPIRVERSDTKCVHTPAPDGYLPWHSWAQKAFKTHSQVRCRRCGKWAIWLPKAAARRVNAEDRAEDRRVLRALAKNKKEDTSAQQ
jgi:hypothetical protein